ncbi:MAG: hypothetical protein ACOCWQ_01715 [Nanoarchaeota archaeon]
MFDKLKFWKKDADDLDFNLNSLSDHPDLGLPQQSANDFGTDQSGMPQQNPLGNPMGQPDTAGMPQTQMQFQEQPQPYQQQMQPHNDPLAFQPMQQNIPQQGAQQMQPATENTPNNSRDIDLILSKIETLKASIDHLTTKVEALERLSYNKGKW